MTRLESLIPFIRSMWFWIVLAVAWLAVLALIEWRERRYRDDVWALVQWEEKHR